MRLCRVRERSPELGTKVGQLGLLSWQFQRVSMSAQVLLSGIAAAMVLTSRILKQRALELGCQAGLLLNSKNEVAIVGISTK